MIVNNKDSEKWKLHGILLFLSLAILLVAYFNTFESMVLIWLSSETFTHGFIIFPMSLWLIWRIRHEIVSAEPDFNLLGIPLLLVLGFVWLFSNFIDIEALQQLAVIAMIPVLVLSIMGWDITLTILFPLLFLFFAVPLGEELTPVLIKYTADFTVSAIQLFGIPVYKEGSYFYLPTGSWSVISACSGVRYLIASVTLGTLYSYLNYQSNFKRIIFILFAIVIPIIANWIRAVIIVLLGHFSNMKIATGVDHIIYGWIFFGIVIGVMFYLGSFWRDEDISYKNNKRHIKFGQIRTSRLLNIIAPVVILAILVIWPVKLHLTNSIKPIQSSVRLPDLQIAGWKRLNSNEHTWQPYFHNFDAKKNITYVSPGGKKITLFIGYYAVQRQDAELGNYMNTLVKEEEENQQWQVIHRSHEFSETLNMNIPTALIRGNEKLISVSYFYYVDGKWSNNKYKTKFMQAIAQLSGYAADGAVVAISTVVDDRQENIKNEFSLFIAKITPKIEDVLKKMKLDEINIKSVGEI